MRQLFHKYRGMRLYIFFGAVTTLVNLVVFKLCNMLLGDSWYLVSNCIAWVAAVLTAFFTNKLWVFESKSWAPSVLWRELPSFIGARVFSLAIEQAGLFLLIDLLHFNTITFNVVVEVTGADISKVILQVVVLVLNYIFSKLVIFKKK